ncbi:MAG: response regulator [bacterium]
MSYDFLIVDDSPIIRSVVRKAIHLSGIDLGTLHEAENGRQALATLEQQHVDVVVADLNMPEMDGVELVRRIHEDLSLTVPVIIVSSDRSADRIEELRARGIHDFLKKPFRPEELMAMVRQALPQQGGSRVG